MGRRGVSKFAYCNVIVFTLILAGITLGGIFAQNISPKDSSILPFIALSLSFLLIANAVMVVYWIFRFRFWFIVPLIAIIGNYQYINRIIKITFSKSIPTVNTLKIATFNADSFGNEWTSASTKEIARYMNTENVDVICFQEFGKGLSGFPLDSICENFKIWKYHLIPLSPDSTDLLQLAVFSRYPIKDNLLMTFKDTPNCSMWCDLNVNGRMIRVFNLHLQTTSASSHIRKMKRLGGIINFMNNIMYNIISLYKDMDNCFVMRAEQATFVRQKINKSPYPVIVCGDFNSLPSSYTYRIIRGKDLQDGFCSSGHGYMYTYRYLKHFLRIDYIMASSVLKSLDYYSFDYDFHSDHNPVIMTIKM